MNRCGWLMADEFVEQQTLIQMWKLLYYRKPALIYDKIEVEDDMTVATNRARLKTVDLGFWWRATDNGTDYQTT